MTSRADPPKTRDGRSAGVRSDGFTLIELITVIVILGILAVVLTTGTGALGGRELARAAEVRAQLRFVQLKAMKTGGVYGMSFDGTNYWGFNGTDPAAAAMRLTLPGETAALISLAGKNMALALPATPYTIFFDGFGIPYTSYASASVNTRLANPANITITAGGASAVLTLTPETGYVP